MYKELVDKDFSWENFTQAEQDEILSAGRSNNCLDTSKLTALCPGISSIKDAVRKALEIMGEMKDNTEDSLNTTIKPGVGVRGLLDGTTLTTITEKSEVTEEDTLKPEN